MNSDNLKAEPFRQQKVHDGDEPDDGISVGEVFAVFMENRLLISAIVIAFAVVGFAYTFVVTPVFRADGLIQVEEKGNGLSALKDLQPLLGDNTTVAAEQEILSSRLVLGRVVSKQRLDVEITPRVFPVIGSAIFRLRSGGDVRAPVLGLGGYAWGGEQIKVDDLKVPIGEQDKQMTIVIEGRDGYSLFDNAGEKILEGVAGVRSTGKGYEIFVSKVLANNGTQFFVKKKSSESSIKSLRESIAIKERGKKSGILEVSLTGTDIEKVVHVLDDVMNTYVRQNVDQRSAEAENTLKFLDAQLPALKKEMEAAEAAYNAYRQNRGSLDLNIETQSVLQSLVEVDNQIVALQQEREELRQGFTAEHPRVKALDHRMERLKDRRAQFDSAVNKLPATQQRVLQLARDVEVTSTLYTNLVNTSQQLKVSKAGTVGDVRIVDSAAASHDPVGMKKPVVLAVAIIVGVLFSAAVIWVRRSLRVVIEDPEVIEAKLGLPVYATIPHSEDEVTISKKGREIESGAKLLAVTRPDDDAVESLRGLRTTIHFALIDASNNSLLITGSSPALGKSFVSKNLSAVLAQCGQRIVIVDADLRRGHIHKEFNLKREYGVSEFVSGTCDYEEIVKPTSVPNLWVVTTGQIPPNPSELLMHLRFEALLEKLASQFDTVIVDAAPILAVSDAAIIGRLTGATLMIARAGHHPISELEQAVKRLNQAGVSVKGFVFNDLDVNRQRYRYGYKGYVYKYSYSKQ